MACGLAAGLGSCGSTSEERAIATMREATDAARRGEWTLAEELALRAREERPGFVDPLFLAAHARERSDRFEDARAAYREILSIDPTSTSAAVALAQTYIAEQRVEEAEDWLRRALEEDPGAEAAVFNLGSVADARGRLDEAAAWFELAGVLDTRDPRSRVQLAGIRLRQGRIDDARRAAEDAVRRAPDYARARAALDAVSRAERGVPERRP